MKKKMRPPLDEVLSRCYEALSPLRGKSDLEKRLAYFIWSARRGVTEAKDVEGELGQDLVQFVTNGGNLGNLSALALPEEKTHFLDLTNEERVVLAYHNLICMNGRLPYVPEIRDYIEKIYGHNFVTHENTVRNTLKKHRLPLPRGGRPTL